MDAKLFDPVRCRNLARTIVLKRWGPDRDFEDGVQDALLGMVKAIGSGKFDPSRGTATSFLSIAGRNEAIDGHRRFRRNQPTDSLNGAEAAKEVRDGLEAAEFWDKARSIAGPIEWRAIEMIFREGVSYRKTAAVLGMNYCLLWRRLQKVFSAIRADPEMGTEMHRSKN